MRDPVAIAGLRALLGSTPCGRTVLLLALVVGIVAAWPDLAFAHDCSGPQDCEQTAGYNAVVSVVGALSAVIAGILGSTFAGTSAGVVAGGLPPVTTPDAGGTPAGDGGGFKELPPGSDGWKVTDGDGKDHVFETEDEAKRYWQHLNDQRDEAIRQENTRQLENDYHNAAEQVEFINSVIRGLKAAGKDASSQIAEADRWARERDRLRGEVGKAGGATDYQTRDHGSWTFGENDDLIRKANEIKESQKKLEAIQRIENAVDRMRDKKMVGGDEGLTDRIEDRLRKLSEGTVSKDGQPPSWDDIDRMRDLVRKDMSATSAKQDAANADWVRDGAASTSREIFTGKNADGETSYKSMVLRGLLGAATGGHSEVGMEVMEKMYGVHDDVMAGKSGLEAYRNAVGRVLVDETIGRITGKTLEVGGKGAGWVYDKTLKGSAVDGWVRDGARSVNTILQKDVKDILRGSTRDVGEDFERRMAHGVKANAANEGRSFEQRQADYEAGRQSGADKVDELKQALEHRRANPGEAAEARVRDAVDAVQQDKHAMHQLNGLSQNKAPNDTIKGFNEELGNSYERAHQTARERIAQEHGVSVDDVQVVKPTNKPGTGSVDVSDPRGFAKRPAGGVETDGRNFTQRAPETPVSGRADGASFDQDVGYRIRKEGVVDPRTGQVHSGHVDVPSADVKRVYNEEFYKARHGGELPQRINPETGHMEVDRHAVDHYADRMDQASTDRLHTESYGTGDRDLKTATDPRARGRDFSDVEQVGKASEHKNYEWQNKAAESRQEARDLSARADAARAQGRVDEANALDRHAAEAHQRAESQIEEGYRQTTKQFRNQLQSRVDEVNRQAGRNVAEVPQRLQRAADIMNDRHLSPVEIERQLGAMGYTPDKVAQQLSSNLEALQKFKPPAGVDWSGAATEGLKAASKTGDGPVGLP